MFCSHCQIKLTEKLITVKLTHRSQLTVIENVPVHFCSRCGEHYLTPEVSIQIGQIREMA